MPASDSTYQITGKFTGVDEIVAGYQRIDASVRQVAGSLAAMADLGGKTAEKARQFYLGSSAASRQTLQDLKAQATQLGNLGALLDGLLVKTTKTQSAYGAQSAALRVLATDVKGLAEACDRLMTSPSAVAVLGRLTSPGSNAALAQLVGIQSSALKGGAATSSDPRPDNMVQGQALSLSASVVNLTTSSLNLVGLGGGASAGGGEESAKAGEKEGDRIFDRIKKAEETIKTIKEQGKQIKEYREDLRSVRDWLDKMFGDGTGIVGGAAAGRAAGAAAGRGAAAVKSAATRAATKMGALDLEAESAEGVIDVEFTILEGGSAAEAIAGTEALMTLPAAGGAAAGGGLGIGGIIEGVLGSSIVGTGLAGLAAGAIAALISNQMDRSEMRGKQADAQKAVGEGGEAFLEAVQPGMSPEQVRALAKVVQQKAAIQDASGLSLERGGTSFWSHLGLDQPSDFNKALGFLKGDDMDLPEPVNELAKPTGKETPEQLKHMRETPWAQLRKEYTEKYVEDTLKNFAFQSPENAKLFLDRAAAGLKAGGRSAFGPILEQELRKVYPELMEGVDKIKAGNEAAIAGAGLGFDWRRNIVKLPGSVSADDGETSRASTPAGGAPSQVGKQPENFAAMGLLAGLINSAGSPRGLSNAYTEQMGVVKQLTAQLSSELGIEKQLAGDAYPKMNSSIQALAVSAGDATAKIKKLSGVLANLKLPPGLVSTTVTIPGPGSKGSNNDGVVHHLKTPGEYSPHYTSKDGIYRSHSRKGYAPHWTSKSIAGSPKHAEGGLVKRDHIAGVHEGELITRAPDVSRLVAAAADGGSGRPSNTVNVTVNGAGDGREVARLVAQAVTDALDDHWARNRKNTEALKDRTLMV